MKYLIILCVLSFVGWTLADLYPRGCIYVSGECVIECEEGTHAYTTGCGIPTPEPTCDDPNPVPDSKDPICDFSACYCDPPTVRHPVSNICVAVEECP